MGAQVKFKTDAIDETDTLFNLLAIRSRQEEGLSAETLELNGTHATPLAPVRTFPF